MTAPVPSASAVAAEIRNRQDQMIPQVKLHKLLYYVQAYHLVWERTPAFAEDIEAWERGPVVADLWRREKSSGGQLGRDDLVPDTVRNTVTNVLRRCESMTGIDLTIATHAEDPWSEATDGGRSVGSQVISHDSLIAYFSRESSDVRRMKESLETFRDDAPFQPDPPGALDALLAGHSAA